VLHNLVFRHSFFPVLIFSINNLFATGFIDYVYSISEVVSSSDNAVGYLTLTRLFSTKEGYQHCHTGDIVEHTTSVRLATQSMTLPQRCFRYTVPVITTSYVTSSLHL
jgi:hypothetical protein